MSAPDESILNTSSVHEAVQISPSLHRVITSQGKAIVVKTLQTHALNPQELQELLDEVKALWMPNRHNNVVSLIFLCDLLALLAFDSLSMSVLLKCLSWIRIHCSPPRLEVCTS